VRDMLGLADRGAQRRLFGALLEGEPRALIEEIDKQYALGVEPLALMRGTMDLAHKITLAQIAGSAADAATQEERTAIEGWADALPAAQIHRLWQLLLKGHTEVRTAPDPLVAAQMALLRVLHAASLPDPGSLVRKLEELADGGLLAAAPKAVAGSAGAPAASAAWERLIEAVDRSGALRVAQTMRDWLRVIELAPGRLVYAPAPGFSDDPAPELRDALLKATGERWQVERGEGEGLPTLRERAEAEQATRQARIRSAPLVEAAFAAFPGAELVEETEAGGNRNWSKRA
jgi:DNA polymerase-3 subunit gamma/tau